MSRNSSLGLHRVILSHHALDRVRERLTASRPEVRSWDSAQVTRWLTDQIRDAALSRVSDPDAPGRETLVAQLEDGSGAVLRPSVQRGTWLVVSVLTPEQLGNNRRDRWRAL